MTTHTVELDVRAQLRNKIEPFELIMGTIKSLKKEDVFVLHATLKPTPLLGIMKLKGYSNQVQKIADDHWVTTFVHKSRKHLLDAPVTQQLEQAQTGAAAATAPDSQGCGCSDEASGGSHRLYTLDNRGLEAPQPMIRTLAQLEKMTNTDVLVITNDRVPAFLIEELKNMGCTYDIELLDVGEQARITIRKP